MQTSPQPHSAMNAGAIPTKKTARHPNRGITTATTAAANA
jgi:hypothetical protein